VHGIVLVVVARAAGARYSKPGGDRRLTRAAEELEYYGPPGDRLPFPPDMQSWLRTRPAEPSKQESPRDKVLEGAAGTGPASDSSHSTAAAAARQEMALV